MSLSTFPFYIQSLGGTEALAGMCGGCLAWHPLCRKVPNEKRPFAS